MERYICQECGESFTGETDCLKHAEKYGHLTFDDAEGGEYEPLADSDILGD